MKYVRLILLFGFVVLARASAQTSEIDLTFAFNQLRTNGPTPFARVLYPEHGDSARSVAAKLTQLTTDAGPFNGFEIVSRTRLTSRVERLTFALYFENYPVFARIDYYASEKHPHFLPAVFSRYANDILPFNLTATAGL
jgi:hypothetical protein